MNGRKFTDEHKPGRINAHACPTGKHVYEAEKHALRALRWMREHGEIRRGQGSIYPCRAGHTPLHYHCTSNRKLRGMKRNDNDHHPHR
jgi:hypothetical protein